MKKGIMHYSLESLAAPSEEQQQIERLKVANRQLKMQIQRQSRKIATEGLFDLFKKKKKEAEKKESTLGEKVNDTLDTLKGFDQLFSAAQTKKVDVQLGCLSNLGDSKSILGFLKGYLTFLQASNKYQNVLFKTYSALVMAHGHYCQTADLERLSKDYVVYMENGPQYEFFLNGFLTKGEEITSNPSNLVVQHTHDVSRVISFEFYNYRFDKKELPGGLGYTYCDISYASGLKLLKPAQDTHTPLTLTSKDCEQIKTLCIQIVHEAASLYCGFYDDDDLLNELSDGSASDLYWLAASEAAADYDKGVAKFGEHDDNFETEGAYGVSENLFQGQYFDFGHDCLKVSLSVVSSLTKVIAHWSNTTAKD